MVDSDVMNMIKKISCAKKLPVVVGPPSSGTRLVWRILNASPDLYPYHDNRHGNNLWDVNKRTVVLVYRDKTFQFRSCQRRGIDTTDFPIWESLLSNYPHAPIVQYSDVVSDVDGVIAELAQYFNIPTWSYDYEIYDADEKYI
jgi:hypothetical protein